MYWYLSFVDQLRGKGVSSSFTWRSKNWRERQIKSKAKNEESVSWIALLGCALYAIDNGIVFVSLIFFVIVFLLDESDVPSSIVSKVSGGVSSVSCL